MNINELVTVERISSRPHHIGFVAEKFMIGDEAFCHVRYLDTDTGEPMVCPDRARCNHGRHCPIHGYNCKEVDLRRISQVDIDFFVAEGMLNKRYRKGSKCRRSSTRRSVSAVPADSA